MDIQNIPTLKIHKLSQSQYNRELAAGRIDPNALYLTPGESTIATDGIFSLTEDNGICISDWNENSDVTDNYGFNGGYENNVYQWQTGFGFWGEGDYHTSFDKYINNPGLTGSYYTNHIIFFVGNGRENQDRMNAIEVSAGGDFSVQGEVLSDQGADYAEMCEWIDGNPNYEDRRGRLVIFEGEKIRFAQAGEEADGVVSAKPSVVGDAAQMQWRGKYLRDAFGEKLYEQILVRPEEVLDSGEVIPAEYEYHPVVNPEYDPEIKYNPRHSRPEWTAVGFVGKLVVVDDGTCIAGGRCASGANGIGTASASGWKVLSRIDDNHVKVLVK